MQDSNIPVSVQVATKVVPPTNRHFYQGTFDAFRQIARSEGLPGLYVGVTPNTVGAGLAWGSYFFFYEHLKSALRKEDTLTNNMPEHMAAAAIAGVGTLVLTNPIWVVKTRMCLQDITQQGVNYRGLLPG